MKSQDNADVMLLAGAPLAGPTLRVPERIPVPVIDCVGAAVKQAVALVALAPGKARAGSFRRPDARRLIGLGSAMADWIAHRDKAR